MTIRRGATGLAGGFAALLAVLQPGLADTPAAACAGRDDDDRVTPIPPALVAPARQALGLAAEAPDAWVQETTVYRCMGGAVQVCAYGANLTCAKGDASRSSPGADAWCTANPGATDVPAVATGHGTIFVWSCAGTKAVARVGAVALDRRGFIADEWKPLPAR